MKEKFENQIDIQEDSQTLDSENQNSGFDPEKKYRNLPLVVIAGRPNVGKSTHFNRFLHKRRSITDPTPGVTRDPILETAFIDGKPVNLMDTGGFKLERDIGTVEAELDELVVQKTLETFKKADLILLLLEAGNITGEDEELIGLLRPYWNKVIAAVNKTEGGRLEEEAWNFMQFGFSELLQISAEHGDHIPDLQELILSRLDFFFFFVGEESDFIIFVIMGIPYDGNSIVSNLL